MHISTFMINAVESIANLSGFAAYGTIVGVLLACGLGLPLPEDITLLTAGFLAGEDHISLVGALIVGFIGVMAGDAILFFLGRRFGKRIFSLGGFRSIFTESRVAAAEARIRHNGPIICFVARFLPGVRAPIFAMSGALGVRSSTFFLLDGFAALISVPIWITLGYWSGVKYDEVGGSFDQALAAAHGVQGYIFAGLAIVIAAYVGVMVVKKKMSVAPAISDLE